MRCLATFFFMTFISFGCYGQSNKQILKLLQKEPDAEMDVLTCDKNWENQLDYATILKVDSIFIRDTIFKDSDFKLDTIIGDE